MNNRRNNNNGLVSSAETLTMLTSLGEPLLSRLRADDEKKIISIIQIDPVSSHDRKLYRRLYNETDRFEVISETEHGGRYSAIIVVRYICKTDEDVGVSHAEKRMLTLEKEKARKIVKAPFVKKSRKNVKTRRSSKTIGFAS